MATTNTQSSSPDRLSLEKYIDHTLLRPDATEAEIITLCREAREHHFFTVCVERKWVAFAKNQLKGSEVKTITVVGFPHGSDSTPTKIAQTKEALAAGAEEIDMVLNRELMRAKNFAGVFQDIAEIVRTAGAIPVKVILETSELADDEKEAACVLASAAGAAFVKTSTGFSKSGANEWDIRRMRKAVGDKMGVKASGGVRTYDDAVRMVEAGATRLGTSASVAIVTEPTNEATGGDY